MDDHRLATGACKARDRGHLRTAIARAVAGPSTVHMAGREAERAVVPMLAAAHRRPDEGAAVNALERFPPLPHRTGRTTARGIAWDVRRRTTRRALRAARANPRALGCRVRFVLVLVFVVTYRNTSLESLSVR